MKTFACIVVFVIAMSTCPQPYQFCADLKLMLDYYCQDTPEYGPGPENPTPEPEINPTTPQPNEGPYMPNTKSKRGRK